jgi:hypothetical protein
MADTKAVSEMLCFEKSKDEREYTYSHQVMFKDRTILELAKFYMVPNLQF